MPIYIWAETSSPLALKRLRVHTFPQKPPSGLCSPPWALTHPVCNKGWVEEAAWAVNTDTPASIALWQKRKKSLLKMFHFFPIAWDAATEPNPSKKEEKFVIFRQKSHSRCSNYTVGAQTLFNPYSFRSKGKPIKCFAGRQELWCCSCARSYVPWRREGAGWGRASTHVTLFPDSRNLLS